MTSGQLLRQAASILLNSNVEQPLLDAQLLLMHCWQKDRVQLILGSETVPEHDVVQQFNALIQRRKKGEPVAYLCGEKEFYSRAFMVNQDVLIPRPETEHLIEAVQKYFPHADTKLSFCDVGTGSGCIAVTLACEFPSGHVQAIDISEKSLAVAMQNAQQHQVSQRMQFLQSNMLQSLAKDQVFDVIVSNPPYVTLAEYQALAPELYFEPRHALTDEDDGLLFLKDLLDTAAEHLNEGGKLIVETGLCGLPKITDCFSLLEEVYDLAGNLRGAVYEKRC
ncbi:MAG: peptide chain release factor N(5)-glutamine methyltransferase [Mariprofundaceae bacterium]|nr:peptide chain release factor N(5)-glutamine methyltransferase [Mariprofundaceae bacterium]